MGARSLLLGSQLKLVVTALGLVTASVGGAFALGLVGAPAVVGVENRFGPVSQDTTIVETDLVVHNPNPIGVQLGGTTVNYTVQMNEIGIAAGQKEGLDVATGNSTLNFSTQMQNSKIPAWWVTHIRNGEVTNVTIDARVQTSLLGGKQFDLQQNQQVETDIIGQFNSNETRPVDGPSNPLYSNPVLYINQTRGEWGSVSQQETPIDLSFTVFNPQSKPYAITEVGYEVTMNGLSVGEGATDRTYVIPGQSTETIETTPVIKNPRLDDWWVSHLENDQVTQLRIDFYAKIELPTGNQIRVPLDSLTYERTIETDIFGNKDEDGASASGSATPTESGSETTADDGATDAPTNSPVDSPVDSPTGSPLPGTGSGTDTDDGGILGVAVDGLD